jgi:uncharacterized membrane protein (DUF106 family)
VADGRVKLIASVVNGVINPMISFGDILFILLILAVIHGIMTLVSRARMRKTRNENLSSES